jgi:uncharacterized membrane protein
MSEADLGQPSAVPSGAALLLPRTVDSGHGWAWIAQGWHLFAKSPVIWIVNFILTTIACVILLNIPLLGYIALPLLVPILFGGLMLGCRSLEQGGSLEVGHLFAGFKTNTVQLLIVGLFVLVTHVIIGFVMKLVIIFAGGAALLAAIASGDITAAIMSLAAFMAVALVAMMVAMLLLVPVLMAVWFAPALVVLRNAQAFEALQASFFANVKNIGPFLVYSLIILVLSVLAFFPFLGFGWLILWPVMVASIYTGYRDIFPEA